MDQFYFEEGYVEAKYFAYTAEAQIGLEPYIAVGYLPQDFFEDRSSFAALYCDAEIVVGMLIEAQGYLTSVFSITASAVKVIEATAAFNAEFTQTTQGLRGQDIEIFAFTDAAIAVAVDRIRDNNISTSAVFDVATDFVVSRSANSDVDAIFSAIIAGLRSRDTSLETQAAFSFDVNVEVSKSVSTQLVSTASITISAERIRNNESSQSTETTQSADGQRIRYVDSQISAEFAQSAQARIVRDAHLTGTGIAAISCSAVKLAVGDSNQTATFTQTFLGGKLKVFDSAMSVRASVFVSRRVAYFNQRPHDLDVYYGTNTAQFSSSIKKFGSHALIGGGLQQNNGYTIPNANEDFYYEAWIYPINDSASVGIRSTYFLHIDQLSSRRLQIRFQVPTSPNTYPSYGYVYQSANNALALETWNHVAIVKTQTQMSYYLNGNRVYTVTDSTIPNGFYGPNNGDYWGSALDTMTGLDQTLVNPTNLYLDEIYFVKNTTLGISPSATTISVPTEERQNSSNVVYLYHFNNNLFDDLDLTQSAAASLSAPATVSAAITYVVDPVIAISSEFTVSATVGTLEDINLSAFSDAAVISEVNVIRSAESAVSIQTTISAVNDVIRSAQSDQQSQITVLTTANRTRDSGANTSIESTVSATVNVQRSAESSLQSTTAVSAVIGTLEDINLTAFADGALSASVVKTARTEINLSSSISSTVDGQAVRSALGDFNSEITTNALGYRVKFSNTQISAETQISAQAVAFIGITSAINTAFVVKKTYFEVQGDYLESDYFKEFDVIAEKTANGQAAISVQASLQANIGGSFLAQLAVDSSASITATVVKTASANISATDAFTQSTQAVKTTSTSVDANSSFVLQCNGVTAGEINMVAFANAALTVTAEANKPFSATIQSAVTVTANTQDSLNSRGSADLTSNFAQSAVAVKTVDAVIQTDSVASALTIAVKEVAVDIVCESQFATVITANRIASGISSQTVTLTTAITAQVGRSAQSQISSVTAISVDPVVIVDAVVSTESVASELAVVARIAAFFVNAEVTANLAVSAQVQRSAQSTMAAQSQVSAGISVIKQGQLTAQTQSTLVVSATVTKRTTAAITSAMSFAVAIRDLRIDEIEYRIPGEGWEYTIAGETRIHVMQGETRQRDILTETGLRTIGSETRIYNIE